MRVIFPDDLRKMMDEVEPYLIPPSKGKIEHTYKEGTPQYIIDMHKECKRRVNELLEI